VVAVAAVTLYVHLGYPWWLLVVVARAPEMTKNGALGGPAPGAVNWTAPPVPAGAAQEG
jgi:hypothetical protein